MKKLFVLLVLTSFLLSCSDYNECTESMSGLYDAQIIGVTGPFTLAVSIDNSDNISIDANWYTDLWVVVEADTDGCANYNADDYGEVDININSQNIADEITISGYGFYYDYSLQLDYKINDHGDVRHFTLVATKR